VSIASAGTGHWHVGSGIDDRAAATLTRAGYDGSRHRAQQFVASWFDDYDLVVAMDRKNRWFLEELAPDAEAKDKIRMLRAYDPTAKTRGELDVPDPYYDDNFAEVLEMVERGCRGLLDEVRQQLAA
jgi:protein-tyrosine phosphatase